MNTSELWFPQVCRTIWRDKRYGVREPSVHYGGVKSCENIYSVIQKRSRLLLQQGLLLERAMHSRPKTTASKALLSESSAAFCGIIIASRQILKQFLTFTLMRT